MVFQATSANKMLFWNAGLSTRKQKTTGEVILQLPSSLCPTLHCMILALLEHFSHNVKPLLLLQWIVCSRWCRPFWTLHRNTDSWGNVHVSREGFIKSHIMEAIRYYNGSFVRKLISAKLIGLLARSVPGTSRQ